MVIKRLLLVLICIFIVSSISAIPYTCQGGINIPKAYVLPSGMFDIAYTMYGVRDNDGFQNDKLNIMHAGILNIGLFDLGEIGIVAMSRNVYYGNCKIKILQEKLEIPALAIGVENIFSKFDFEDQNLFAEGLPDRNDYTKNSPYIVASKSALLLTDIGWMSQVELVLTVGVGWRKFHAKGNLVKIATGRFWGLDVRLSDRFGFNFEFDAHNFNTGLSVFYKNLELNAGIFELEDYWGMKGGEHFYKFAFNIKYTFDNLSEVKINKYNEYHFTDYPYSDPQDYLYDTYPELPYTERHAQELEEIRKLYHE